MQSNSKLLSIVYPEIYSQLDIEKNKKDNIDIMKLTQRSDVSVWWICPEFNCEMKHIHSFKTAVKNRTSDKKPSKCPYCIQPQKKVCECKSVKTLFPDIAKELHPTLNEGIDLNTISPQSHIECYWLCQKNDFGCNCQHVYKARIQTRTLGKNLCNGKYCKHRFLEYQYPEIFKQIHPTKNPDIDIHSLTVADNKSIIWQCSNSRCGCAHEWPAPVSSRTDKRKQTGCPFCSKCSPTPGCIHNTLKYLFPDIHAQLHPTMNQEVETDMILPGNKNRLWWQCQVDSTHFWNSTVGNRTSNKSGCPRCNYSKTEVIVFEWLRLTFVDLQINAQQKFDWCINEESGRKLPFDIYIPELNIITEIDGDQHFKQVMNWQSPEMTQKHDIFKMKSAIANGISVIRLIQEDVYQNKFDWKLQLKSHLIKKEIPEVLYLGKRLDLYSRHIELMNE